MMWANFRNKVVQTVREATRKGFPSNKLQPKQTLQTQQPRSSPPSVEKLSNNKNYLKDSKGVMETIKEKASQAFYRGATAVTSSVSGVIKKSSYWAVSKSKDVITKSTQSVSDTIRSKTTGKFQNMQESGKTVVRWFWWWSLAAIGVYGIATTVPKELIRYAVQEKVIKDNSINSWWGSLSLNDSRDESGEDDVNNKAGETKPNTWQSLWWKSDEKSEKKAKDSTIDRWWA